MKINKLTKKIEKETRLYCAVAHTPPLIEYNSGEWVVTIGEGAKRGSFTMSLAEIPSFMVKCQEAAIAISKKEESLAIEKKLREDEKVRLKGSMNLRGIMDVPLYIRQPEAAETTGTEETETTGTEETETAEDTE